MQRSQEELAALKVSHVNIAFRTIYTEKDKKHNQRTIVFHSATADDLNCWLKKRQQLDLPDYLEALFVSWHRGQWRDLTDSGMRQALYRSCEKTQIKPFRFHDFRHAYAVFALRNRADLSDIQKQLGHMNIATTARYLMVDDEDRRDRHDRHSPRANL